MRHEKERNLVKQIQRKDDVKKERKKERIQRVHTNKLRKTERQTDAFERI